MSQDKLLIKSGVNYELIIHHMIKECVKGPDSIYIAIREAINNSFDSGANLIKIRIGMHKNKIALIISDNGRGMDFKSRESIMGYGFSSKSLDDPNTIGKWGTGLKSFLGCGKIDETQIDVVTCDHDTYYSMDITAQYLINLCKQKDSAGNHIESIKKPSDWSKDIDRITGTTLYITGLDGKKLKDATLYVHELSNFITPRATAFVKVLVNGEWEALKPKTYKGVNYKLEFKTKILGEVHFDVWYGNENSDGTTICGEINEILSFGKLWQSFGVKQKNQIATVWRSVSGNIYIQNAKLFREHDNSFSDEFFTGDAALEFIELLNLVGEEIDELNNKELHGKILEDGKKFLKDVIHASNKLSKPEYMPVSAKQGPQPNQNIMVDQDYYILPKNVNISDVGSSIKIILRNGGRKDVDFVGTIWSIVKGDSVVLKKPNAQYATVTAVKNGVTIIKVKNGSFGESTITVNVNQQIHSIPWIAGSPYVQPNGVYEYELIRYSSDEIIWKLENENNNSQVKFIYDKHNSKKISLDVAWNCPDCVLTLSVSSRKENSLIAKKKINVLQAGARDRLPILRIGKMDYMLQVGYHFPNTIAQINNLTSTDITEIIFNPLHARIKNLPTLKATDIILSAIANMAVIDQVSQGVINVTEAQPIVEEWIMAVKNSITTKIVSSKKGKKNIQQSNAELMS